MAKKKQYQFYVINLPIKENYKENEKLYKEFFQFLFNHRKPEKIKADKGAIIRRCSPTDNNEALFGYISTFTLLDGKDWIDTDTLEKDQVSIPKNKYPNLKEIMYFFFPKHHRLLLLKTSNSISLTSVLLYLYALKQRVKKYDFDVIPETSSNIIDEILNADGVLSLNLAITYTNAGIGSDAYDFVDKQLKNSKTNSLKIEARAERGGSIDIGKSVILQGATELVKEYGSGTAVIVKGGKKKKIDTKQHPFIMRVEANINEFKSFIDKLVTSLNNHLK